MSSIRLYILGSFIFTSGFLFGQSDSLKFKTIQLELNGCWKTKHYQFKYDSEMNLGSEYKSKVHSSAPIFKLIQKKDDIFIEWIELTGGKHLQKIAWIKKNKLQVKNETGLIITYKRTKDCK